MPSSSTRLIEMSTDALGDKRPLVLFAGQNVDSAHDAILAASSVALDVQITIQDGALPWSRA